MSRGETDLLVGDPTSLVPIETAFEQDHRLEDQIPGKTALGQPTFLQAYDQRLCQNGTQASDFIPESIHIPSNTEQQAIAHGFSENGSSMHIFFYIQQLAAE